MRRKDAPETGNTMELLYVVCQIAAAGICEEHRTAYPSDTPLACVFMAPQELARLQRPGWRVASWRCEGPRPERLVPVTMSDRTVPGAR
jgi:hypothetical protein